jgi:hypothetical protein
MNDDQMTPGDWMNLATRLGWNILSMSAGRPVRFQLSDGSEAQVSHRLGRDILDGLARSRER